MAKKNKDSSPKSSSENSPKNSPSPIISAIIKLGFEFLKKGIHDWDKKSGSVELNVKYKSLQKKFDKDFKHLKDKIEKLTLRLYWMNMLIIILSICVLIQLIYIIAKI